jgi:membrane protein DedA with SNARE-associated domain
MRLSRHRKPSFHLAFLGSPRESHRGGRGGSDVMESLIAVLKPYLHQYGYWTVFFAIMLEDFGLPVPGEAVLVASALLASEGAMQIVPLLLTAWIAAVIGDNIGYTIGRFGGRFLVFHYGHYVFVTKSRLEYAEGFFGKYGKIVVIGARFFLILRQLNGIVAGISKMDWRYFLPYNAIGAALWVGLWGTLFYVLGQTVTHVANVFETFLFIAFMVTVVVVGFYLWRSRKK